MCCLKVICLVCNVLFVSFLSDIVLGISITKFESGFQYKELNYVQKFYRILSSYFGKKINRNVNYVSFKAKCIKALLLANFNFA